MISEDSSFETVEGVATSYEYQGKTIDLTENEVRLDITSPLEVTLLLFAIFSGVGILSVAFIPQISWGWKLFPVGLMFLFIFLYRGTDCLYLLDNQNRCLDYSRTFLGSVKRHTVCEYAELFAVTIKGSFHRSKQTSWWMYHVLLVTKEAEVVLVSDGFRNDLAQANSIGRLLAAHLEIDLIPGVEHLDVRVDHDPDTGKIEISHEKKRFDKKKFYSFLIWMLLIVSIIVAVVSIST